MAVAGPPGVAAAVIAAFAGVEGARAAERSTASTVGLPPVLT